MLKKILLWLVWIGFVSYAFLLAPPTQPNTVEFITNLSIGKWEGINPLIIALFYIMGIWPLIYACLLLIDARGQKIKAFPFVITSFGVGIFAILPYLALRQPNPGFVGEKNLLLKILDSRITGILLTLGVIVLVGFGFSQGNWGDFVRQWQTSRFIHVMSLDFCLLCLLFPTVLGDDLARRGIKNQSIYWLLSFIPLLGASLYLCVRPPLPDPNLETISGTA